MIERAEIDTARDRIAPYIRETPVLKVEAGGLLDGRVALKLEHLQITGSFKVRGAFNNLLSAAPGAEGVVAVSGGNHGAAVAYAATRLGTRATIFVPKALAKEVKLARMRGFGAEVVVPEGSVAEVMELYRRHAEETGALAVHPYDSAQTLAGQGTLGLEILEQLPDLDTLFVSVGGGGLIGGIAAAIGDRVRVVAVETEGTDTLSRTFREGPGFALEASGVAASSLGAPALGTLAREIAEARVATRLVLPDAAVYEAQRRLWEAARIVAEPGAAVALAPLISGAYVPGQDETVAVLICGGNAEPDWFLR